MEDWIQIYYDGYVWANCEFEGNLLSVFDLKNRPFRRILFRSFHDAVAENDRLLPHFRFFTDSVILFFATKTINEDRQSVGLVER